jgi:hypothetical protein
VLLSRQTCTRMNEPESRRVSLPLLPLEMDPRSSGLWGANWPSNPSSNARPDRHLFLSKDCVMIKFITFNQNVDVFVRIYDIVDKNTPFEAPGPLVRRRLCPNQCILPKTHESGMIRSRNR